MISDLSGKHVLEVGTCYILFYCNYVYRVMLMGISSYFMSPDHYDMLKLNKYSVFTCYPINQPQFLFKL